MNEHDDDLESGVHEGPDQERDAFPDTADELDIDPNTDHPGTQDDDQIDEDPAEI
jgi:hypothetical protein